MNIAIAIAILMMLVLGAIGYQGRLSLDGALGLTVIGLACVVVLGLNIIRAAVRK